ncbi:MAG: single-stranded DNA-binding protein [Pyrinomonadaceae bacterium]
MSFNKIILVGNLGKDPELRYTPQGTAVCDFTMATNEKKRDKSGEFQSVATWFRVTLWSKTAENAAKYLTKGTQVYIEGRLGVEEWTDRDGNKRFTFEVHGTDMQFLGSGGNRSDDYSAPAGSNQSEFAGPATQSQDPPAAEFSRPSKADDDIPF